jgi:hypothetical protein
MGVDVRFASAFGEVGPGCGDGFFFWAQVGAFSNGQKGVVGISGLIVGQYNECLV